MIIKDITRIHDSLSGRIKTKFNQRYLCKEYKKAKSLGLKTTQEQQQAIISMALGTPEGKIALAQAMVEPIKASLNYAGIGKKILFVDELPQGAYINYKKDKAKIDAAMKELL